MKAALIFPPDWNSLFMPYSSTPCIKAYLKEGGIDVSQYDLNIEVYDSMLHPAPLIDLWKKTPWEDDLPAPSPGAPGRTQVGALLGRRVHEIFKGIEEAVSILRTSEKLYNPEKYRWALSILDGAILLISASSWELDDSLKSPAVAFEAAQNPSINVYLPYLTKYMDEILAQKPNLIGISVTWPRQMIPAISIAQYVKSKAPGIHVCLGGAYPTLIDHVIEQAPELFTIFDSIAISEGEVAVLSLAKAIESDGSIGEVPGILYLDNGKVSKTSLPVMEDADTLPTPDFDQLPLKKYLSPEPVLPVFSSRGCYWRKCTFCMRPDRRTFSQRSPQQVIKDLAALSKRHKTRAFHFTDNAIRPRRMSEIAEGLTEAGLEILWTARTRFSPEITWDWCDQVAAGGCARIIFGVESASKRILDIMDKGFHAEDIPETLQGLSKAGIDVSLYFIVGFPTEKIDESRKTIQYIGRLKDSLTPYAQYYATLFAAAHGSIVHQNPAQFGITRIERHDPGDMRNPYYYDFDVADGMSRTQAMEQYQEFVSTFEKLMVDTYRMPHDMLLRHKESQESISRAETKMLKMNFIPKLADDLRAEKGYLLKGQKRFRIDEQLRKLIELLDSKRSIKQIVQGLSKAGNIPTTTAFIYTQQLYEEGIIDMVEPEPKR